MYKKEYLSLYGFLSLGQAGGNLTKRFEEEGFPYVCGESSKLTIDVNDKWQHLPYK